MPGRRRKVSGSVKRIVAHRQQWRCAGGCNQMLPAAYEVDHVLPVYLGGSDAPDNLQALCNNCHAEKSLHESAMRENPGRCGRSTLWCVACHVYHSAYFPHAHRRSASI